MSHRPGRLICLALGMLLLHAPRGTQAQTPPKQPPAKAPASVPLRALSTVTSPHGTALKEACASCHKADGWTPVRISPSFRHAERTFPLSGAHERATCQSCHKQLDFKGVSTTCASCHTDPHKGEFGTTCARCHSTRSFVERGTSVRTHQSTRFPLRGAHAIATCESCHIAASPGQTQFAARGTSCESCHLGTFRAVKSPDHVAARFPTDCTSCHTISTWTGATFDHSTTQFALTGRHQAATCQGCHQDGVFTGRSTTCVSCHQTDYANTREPRHGQGFPTTCESCHTTAQWKGAQFDHQTQTRFPLTGGHRAVNCTSCHVNAVYSGTPTTCVSCHQGKAAATTSPHHTEARFAATCESCHSTSTWDGAPYDHARTRFPLTGAHVPATCLACHTDRVYTGKSTVCQSCHQTDFDAAKQPDHRTLGFPNTCESCHTTATWNGGAFDHGTATRFVLTGAHRTATCASCHGDGVYRGKPTTCVGCHQTKYDATTSPHHAAAGMATTCETCHTTVQWTGVAFDHSRTRFPLLGKHVPATCLACHNDRVYVGKPSVCASCHQADYDGSRTPDHRASGIPATCESCHTASGWKPATFDHNATQFALEGAHRAVNCQACHGDGVYRGKPTTCVSCHQAKFDATTEPNHRSSGYSTSCETCHTVAAWKPANFDHATTRFPLNGAHRTATCANCHGDGVFRGKPTTCVGCHQAKFDATTQPNHRTSAFPTTCTSCHTEVAWKPATFDHNTTRFALNGAHRAATCLDCHGDGVYRGKPTTCVGCHQTTFDATTQPNHRTSAFPTTCTSCHTEVAWKPATFDHAATRFPLLGAHRTETCAACHGDGVYRGKPSTCVSCHQAKFDATTQPNHRAASFPTTCESCHTSTAWKPGTFDHAATPFPLTGAHVAATCLACHNDGVYRGKPTACSACHTTDFNATTNPNHRTAGFPTTCESCHTTARWTGATFNHDGPWFPIYSGKHRNKWTSCTQCHTNSANYREFTCLSCHEHNQTKMDDTHRGRSGYRYESASCYSCHPRGNS